MTAACSYAPGSTAEVKVDRIPLPKRFGPTFNQTGGTYHPRQWLSPLDPDPVVSDLCCGGYA